MSAQVISIGTYRLKDGSVLDVRMGINHLPELCEELASLLAPSGFPDLDIVLRFLAGPPGVYGIQRHFFGYRNGELVGFVKYDASDAVPYVSSLGYVFTAEKVRGLGIALYMCRAAVEEFRRSGGKASFLATAAAMELYQRVGYVPFIGHVMVNTMDMALPDFLAFYFAGKPLQKVRCLEWRDWAMAAVLYAACAELHVRDSVYQLYSGPGRSVDRFQSVVPPLMRAQEAQKGLTLVAEDLRGHLIGITNVLWDASAEAPADFCVHKTADDAFAPLMTELCARARRQGMSALILRIAEADERKLEMARAAGAVPVGTSEGTASGPEPMMALRLRV